MKTEKMSLSELGQEYEKHAELQQFFIDRCREDIERAKKSGDSNAVKELEAKLCKFRAIRREIIETSLQLKAYYKEKGDFHGK